jgi:hypothetical protein
MATAAAEFDPKDPLASFGATWKKVMLEPRLFFDTLPPAGGLQPPLAFAAICLTIGGIEFMLFGGGIRGLIGLFAIGVLRLFVGTAIVALVAQQLFEGRGDYEATFRAIAYSMAVVALIGLPIVKYFAALYGAYLALVGIARAQSFDTVRALLTMLASAFAGMLTVYGLGLWPWMCRVNPLLR